MIYHDILKAVLGTTPKFGFDEYGSGDQLISLTKFLHGGSVTTTTVLDTINNYELKWGIRYWPWVDISNPIPGPMAVIAGATSQTGTSQTAPLYTFGYFTQRYPIATAGGVPIAPACYLPGSPTDPNANVNNQEFWLVKDSLGNFSLTPALAYGSPGVVIDSPGLVLSFFQAYDKISSTVGFQNFIALSDVPLADHPINYGGTNVAQLVGNALGEPGNSGGHNLNSYVRFANSAFIISQLSGGNHVKDNTSCLIFPLKGSSGFVGAAQVPSPTQASDIDNYHKLGNVNQGVVDGYGGYLAASGQMMLELQVRQHMDPTGTKTFLRTSIPLAFWIDQPLFANIPKEMVLLLDQAFALFQATGGSVGTPYWDESNMGDDASVSIGPGVGGTPFDNCASAQAVANYYLTVLPNWTHHPFWEKDTFGQIAPKWPAYTTQPPVIVRAAAVPMIPHFGSLLSKMDSPAGWTAYEADAVRCLTLSHSYNIPWLFAPLGLVCHQWGGDSYTSVTQQPLLDPITLKRRMTLSDFKVVYWEPTTKNLSFAQDVATMQSYVQAGGNTVTPVDLQAGWNPALNTLFGESWAVGSGGSLLQAQNPSHPIWNPYPQTDVNAAFPSASVRGNALSVRTRLDPTNITPLITDTNAGDAAWIHKYGAGNVVVWPIHRGGDGLDGDGLACGFTYLILNSIIWLGGGTPPGPYLPKFVDRTAWAAPLNVNGQGSFSGVSVAVGGLMGASNEKFVLISNANTTTMPVSINLSSAFYGFANPWQLSDRNTGLMLNGSGDVVLNLTAPAQDWLAFYTSSAISTIATTVRVAVTPG